MRSRLALLALVVLPLTAHGFPSEEVRSDAPTIYTVQKGDTLWGIAAKFLDKPWQWPELWDRNPFISNPDLIYPGDRLRLISENGESRLKHQRGERLAPTVEEGPAQRLEAISTVDPDQVRPFLRRYGLTGTRKDPDAGGSLVASSQDAALIAAGDRVFFQMQTDNPQAGTWFVYDRPQPLTDPQTGERLGFLIRHAGVARLDEPTGTGLFAGRIRESFTAIEPGAQIYRGHTVGDLRFFPRKGPDVTGRILRPVGEESILGQGQMVVVDVGAAQGLQRGDVLAIQGAQRKVANPVTEEPASIPGTEKGSLMIVRTAKQVSFGLIVTSTRTIEKGDRIRQPEE